MTNRGTTVWQRLITAVVLVTMLVPMLVAPASAQIFTRKPNQPGMSTGKKVLLLGGAALLYYLWRRHQANATRQGQVATNGQQLYRSRNGGVYYRDANHRPVWLTVPNQAMQVPATEVQRYAPNYRRYRGPAPTAPPGYRTQPFSEFDNTVPMG